MIDRLKIRVWDKEEERYWKKNEIKANLEWLMFPEEYKEENYPPDYVEVEQCTGLKDDNGKLIYENDLVKLGGYGVCQVIRSDDTAEFMFKNLNEDLREHVDTMLFSTWEVIGNIHINENKELLK